MKFRAAVLLLFMFLASCASMDPLRQFSFDVRESYRAPDRPDLYMNGEKIGLLTATDGEDGVEYKKLLGDLLEEAIKKERPERAVVPYWKSLSTINGSGFNGDYAEMIKYYTSTGILEKKMLNKLGEALGVDYFLQPRIVNFRQSQSTRFGAFGLTLVKTHESEIKLYMEMWDARTGEILWIGVAESNMASERFMAKPIPFEEIARKAVDKLITKMP